MRIPLERQGSTPLYRQIEDYLRQGIVRGILAPEMRLPASRQLAQALGVNRLTVEAAYANLEADGLVLSRVGSGTYVQRPEMGPSLPVATHEAHWPLWQQQLSGSHPGIRDPLPDERLRAARHAHPIAFAGGISDSHLFPADDFRRVLQLVMRRDGAEAVEYEDRRGFGPLRQTIALTRASQGVQTSPDQILVTAGSQQALALVCQALLVPGDAILVESPTYSGALELFRAHGYRPVGIPVDDQGMQVERLEGLLQQHHPKLIYTIPTFHNPTGTCLNATRRRQLILLADRYNVPILEDDFVGDLRYEGRAQPALKALDPGGRVIYVGTFSKMLMPGLRVGFLAAEGPVFDRLLDLKRVSDLATSGLVQRALEAYVTVGRYQAHLRRTCQIFRKRRDAMVSAVQRHLPPGTYLAAPQGGLFAWIRLPDGLSSDTLLPLACEAGVNFASGRQFFPDGAAEDGWMRLNFVAHPPEDIDEGMRRLGECVRRMGGRSN